MKLAGINFKSQCIFRLIAPYEENLKILQRQNEWPAHLDYNEEKQVGACFKLSNKIVDIKKACKESCIRGSDNDLLPQKSQIPA